MAGAQPRVPGIFGEDNRVPITSTAYPWQAVGRLNNTLGTYCTGTVIGPRRVLTATHCLRNDRTGDWLPPCALHFLAGYSRSSFLVHALVVAYERIGKYRPDAARSADEFADDWAVLTLAEDVASTITAVPTAALDSSLLSEYRAAGIFVQAGYSRDRPHMLTADKTCELLGFTAEDQVVAHTCDATYGDSGSPIFLESDGEFHIVAVIAGGDDITGYGFAVTGRAFHEFLQSLPPPPPAPEGFMAC